MALPWADGTAILRTPLRRGRAGLSISDTGRFVTGSDALVTCAVSPPDGSRLVGATFVVGDVSTTASIDDVRLMRLDASTGTGDDVAIHGASVAYEVARSVN